MTGHLAPWIALTIAAISAIIALSTYRANSNTRRSEFLLQLHKSFFVDETYKPVRVLLDDSGADAKLNFHLAVDEETQELTDFLNFFELVAYFQNSGTLRRKDVRALLGYYLDLLRADSKVYRYITRDDKSFEHLSRLLLTKERTK